MPEPPHVGLITRYVFENPWPLAVVLLAVGVVLLRRGLHEGLDGSRRVGFVLLPLGLAVIMIAYAVTTSGEQAKSVARLLTEAAASNNLTGADAMFTDDATMALGSPNSPGYDREKIREYISRLGDVTINKNTITSLKGYSQSGDRAVVHMSCRTDVDSDYVGTLPSQWVLEIERGDDGLWLIRRIVCVSVMGRSPSTSW